MNVDHTMRLGAHNASGWVVTCSEESHSNPESDKLSVFVTLCIRWNHAVQHDENPSNQHAQPDKSPGTSQVLGGTVPLVRGSSMLNHAMS